MKIQVISDLHLDHGKFEVQPVAPTLVIAGDLSDNYENGLAFLDSCLPKFDRVICVLGNHDFFGGADMEEIEQAYALWDISNPSGHMLFDDVLEIEEKMIYGGVMWTKYWGEPHRAVLGARSMPGFRMMSHKGGQKLVIDDFVEFHDTFVTGLENSQRLYNLDLVISHHAPHPKSIHESFRNSIYNPCFMEDMRPTLTQEVTWIHGHVHNVFDYTAEDFQNSRVVCNPKGYPGWESNNGFNPTKIIEI